MAGFDEKSKRRASLQSEIASDSVERESSLDESPSAARLINDNMRGASPLLTQPLHQFCCCWKK